MALQKSTESPPRLLLGAPRRLRCRDRALDLERPRVMGILNVTPDSFSDAGRFVRNGRVDIPAVVDAGTRMVSDGAALLDVGGESTRPGAEAVEVTEELRRVIPAIEALAHLDVVLSIDTFKPEVARTAIAAGAHLVNDVTGARNETMVRVLEETRAAVCVMHMQGEPRTMQRHPTYTEVVGDVSTWLATAAGRCIDGGVDAERILVDPGIGFGKTVAHNLALLRELGTVVQLGFPVLIGASRKSTIGALTGRGLADRLAGGLAAAVLAVERGALVIRTHDVAETVDALTVATAILSPT